MNSDKKYIIKFIGFLKVDETKKPALFSAGFFVLSTFRKPINLAIYFLSLFILHHTLENKLYSASQFAIFTISNS